MIIYTVFTICLYIHCLLYVYIYTVYYMFIYTVFTISLFIRCLSYVYVYILTLCWYIHCLVIHMPQVERDSLRQTTDQFLLDLVLIFPTHSTSKNNLLIFCVKVRIETHIIEKEKIKVDLLKDIKDWRDNVFISLTVLLSVKEVCNKKTS